MEWAKLIHEHHDWEAYNFPNVTLLQDLMGVQEEIGELTHHHLKRTQGIRGSQEEHIRGGQDAVGDVTIYLLGVMHHLEIKKPMELTDDRIKGWHDADRAILVLGCHASYLIGACVGLHEGKEFAVAKLIQGLRKYCELMAWDFERIVYGTWAQVKRRDWIADPNKGVVATDAVQGR